MAKEIEHKYLVKDDSFMQAATKIHKIVQGYISRDPERVVRIRIIDESAFLTIKGKTCGDVREEFEYEIPISDAEKLLTLCDGRIIRKTRYIVNHFSEIWEIDVFEGDLSGLVIAEIELPDESHEYELPSFIGENVSSDPKYYNSNL